MKSVHSPIQFFFLILLTVMLIAPTGCTSTENNEDSHATDELTLDEVTGDETSSESSENAAEASPETDGYTYVIETDVSNLESVLAGHVAKAKELDQTPFVYFTAGWCPPCQAIKKYANDPDMVDAYQGTYIVEVDYDEVDGAVSYEYGVGGIPAWSGLNDEGKTNDLWVDGGAWGENIPANMAPVLKSYFNWTGDPLDFDL